MQTPSSTGEPVTAIAPGKVIVSGEHAVVYDRPALVMAVNRHARAHVSARAEPGLALELPELDESRVFDPAEVRALTQTLAARYERFLAGEVRVDEVLEGPTHLPAYALALLLDSFFLKPDHGLHVTLTSDVPLGCGMGSSAAVTVALLEAAAAFFELPREPDRIYGYATECEKLQHGRPSGVDPYIALHGGFIRFRKGQAEETLHPPAGSWALVHTGTPGATTGECVMQVARNFEHDAIWEDFEAVTHGMDQALAENDRRAFREHMRENHRLLVRIGVVPERVQAFVERVENAGGAAKVCGAGSITGDNAGIVLVDADETPDIHGRSFGYDVMHVEGEAQGVRLVENGL